MKFNLHYLLNMVRTGNFIYWSTFAYLLFTTNSYTPNPSRVKPSHANSVMYSYWSWFRSSQFFLQTSQFFKKRFTQSIDEVRIEIFPNFYFSLLKIFHGNFQSVFNFFFNSLDWDTNLNRKKCLGRKRSNWWQTGLHSTVSLCSVSPGVLFANFHIYGVFSDNSTSVMSCWQYLLE